MFSLEDTFPSNVAFQTFIGVVVSVCGNALISVALNLQKLAHNIIRQHQIDMYFASMDEPQWISTSNPYHSQDIFFPDDGYSSPRSSLDECPRSPEEELEHRKYIMAMAQDQTRGGRADYLRSKLWWLGISLMVLGEVGNFVAYGFAPASTIAPLGTTTLVSNVILAPMMVKEPFRKRDFIGVALAVAGAAMVVLSSNAEETALTPDLIMAALTQMRSLVYFVVTGGAIALLSIASPLYGASSIMIDLGLVALYGGYTVLCTKSLASLLSLTFLIMFTYPISYLLIVALIVTAVLQIKYLNKALQRFDSTAVIPTQFVLFTISAIVGSAVLYHDFDNMSMDQTSRFMTGCAVEFLGVYLITSKRDPNIISLPSDDSDPLAGFASSATIVGEATAGGRGDVSGRCDDALSDHFVRTDTHAKRTTTSVPVPVFIGSPPQGGDNGQLSNRGSLSDDWYSAYYHASADDYNIKQHRRQSSVIRGISLASQLVDRLNEDSSPPSSMHNAVNNRASFGSLSHRRSESSNMSHLIPGFTMMMQNNHHPDADAVEIEVPTASQIDSTDRELTLIQPPTKNKRYSHRLSSLDDQPIPQNLNG